MRHTHSQQRFIAARTHTHSHRNALTHSPNRWLSHCWVYPLLSQSHVAIVVDKYRWTQTHLMFTFQSYNRHDWQCAWVGVFMESTFRVKVQRNERFLLEFRPQFDGLHYHRKSSSLQLTEFSVSLCDCFAMSNELSRNGEQFPRAGPTSLVVIVNHSFAWNWNDSRMIHRFELSVLFYRLNDV